MKRNLLLIVLAAALVGAPYPAWGDSYVMAVPKSVGTPITSLPCAITQPGFYYLKENLTTIDTGTAITVGASEVTLDLMGFSLAGPLQGTGISISAGMKNVEVRNGQIRNFTYGVYIPSGGSNHRLANLNIRFCTIGIEGESDALIITGCQATLNATGISCSSASAVIDQNISSYNIMYGFALYSFRGTLTNNFATNNQYGVFLGGDPGQLVDRNVSAQNSGYNWIFLPGCTAGLNTPP